MNKLYRRALAATGLINLLCGFAAAGAMETDPQTGHVVKHLSRDLCNEGRVFYFHQDPFSDNRTMFFKGHTNKKDGAGWRLYTVNLETGQGGQFWNTDTHSYETIGKKRQELFYFTPASDGIHGEIRAIQLRTKTERVVTAGLPFENLRGVNLTLNADETLLATAYAEHLGDYFDKYTRNERWAAFAKLGLTNHILTIRVDTGVVRDIYQTNAWLGHVQFSPTDPNLLEFCREISFIDDPVKDRMWLLRADGTGLGRPFPQRPDIDMVTHEFWSPSGKQLLFDTHPLHLSGKYYFGSVDVARWQAAKAEPARSAGAGIPVKPWERLWSIPTWSFHFNAAHSGELFCGDGSARDGVKGCWVWVYRPQADGTLMAEKIFNMEKHDYKRCEPNAHFDPSDKWVIFTYNGGGKDEVMAVSVDKP